MNTVWLLGVLLLTVLVSGCAPNVAAAEHVTISFRYSHFEPRQITVRAGVPITFTLRNDDPIEHEWIVGRPSLHATHRTGTEPYHEGRSDEVTVPPYATRQTTLVFDQPGTFAYICHLPGHEAYGMTGSLVVMK